jgi:CheY-like chemotaxis protein
LISEKKKILVVEDNTETQLIIKVNLRDIYIVEFTDNAEDALVLIRENNFDLVLLDINLAGEQDGKDVLNKIKGELNLPLLPVIIITAYDLQDEEKDRLKKLSNAYLEKPLAKDILLNTISKCLRSGKMIRTD